MKLFVNIVIGIVAVSVAVLCWLAHNLYTDTVTLANFIKTAPARESRQRKREEQNFTEEEKLTDQPLNDLKNEKLG